MCTSSITSIGTRDQSTASSVTCSKPCSFKLWIRGPFSCSWNHSSTWRWAWVRSWFDTMSVHIGHNRSRAMRTWDGMPCIIETVGTTLEIWRFWTGGWARSTMEVRSCRHITIPVAAMVLAMRLLLRSEPIFVDWPFIQINAPQSGQFSLCDSQSSIPQDGTVTSVHIILISRKFIKNKIWTLPSTYMFHISILYQHILGDWLMFPDCWSLSSIFLFCLRLDLHKFLSFRSNCFCDELNNFMESHEPQVAVHRQQLRRDPFHGHRYMFYDVATKRIDSVYPTLRPICELWSIGEDWVDTAPTKPLFWIQ